MTAKSRRAPSGQTRLRIHQFTAAPIFDTAVTS